MKQKSTITRHSLWALALGLFLIAQTACMDNPNPLRADSEDDFAWEDSNTEEVELLACCDVAITSEITIIDLLSKEYLSDEDQEKITLCVKRINESSECCEDSKKRACERFLEYFYRVGENGVHKEFIEERIGELELTERQKKRVTLGKSLF